MVSILGCFQRFTDRVFPTFTIGSSSFPPFPTGAALPGFLFKPLSQRCLASYFGSIYPNAHHHTPHVLPPRFAQPGYRFEVAPTPSVVPQHAGGGSDGGSASVLGSAETGGDDATSAEQQVDQVLSRLAHLVGDVAKDCVAVMHLFCKWSNSSNISLLWTGCYQTWLIPTAFNP